MVEQGYANIYVLEGGVFCLKNELAWERLETLGFIWWVVRSELIADGYYALQCPWLF